MVLVGVDIRVVVGVRGHWCGHWRCWIGIVLALYFVLGIV